MKKMAFVCSWEKNREYSWSGTHYGLYSSLKQYFDVVDYPLQGSFLRKVFVKLGLLPNDFGMHDMKKQSSQFKFDKDAVIFQFGEAPYSFNKKQFIYQDLSVCNVAYMYENQKELFPYSGYSKIPYDSIHKRKKYQSDFYFSDNCAGIFTMGKWFADFLVNEVKVPSEKVFHVGGGINLNLNKRDTSMKKGNAFLFCGKAFERKNGPLVVEAFKLLKKRRPDVILYIAGPTDLNIVSDGIKCLGLLSHEEEIEYFNRADVFVMPSLFEAYGLVFPEALLFGMPCVGRAAFEMPYFIEEGKTGYLLENQSAEELSVLMEKSLLLKDNVNAKFDFYKEEYSWNTVAKRIADIIGKIV